jgi:hypothetical protein
MFIQRVIQALDRAEIRYVLVGGYAVALHGAVRGTVDLDFVIALEQSQFEAVELALQRLGLEPRLPVTAAEVFQFREEYIQRRNLTAWSFINPDNPLEVVDILITHDADAMQNVTKKMGELEIRIATIDELIAMKQRSDRPQDRADIRALEKLR